MNFAFSEEQEELRRITRQFLESKSPESEVRRLMDTDEGYDPAVWSQMANELGLQSLVIPEEYGGQGFTFVELTVVLEEMGRALLCAPYFSSCVLATSALLHAGVEGPRPTDHRQLRPQARRADLLQERSQSVETGERRWHGVVADGPARPVRGQDP